MTGAGGTPLRGRVALVTGGGRGIGRAISETLAARGAAVAVNYRRDAAAAAATVASVCESGGAAAAYCASVDDYEQSEVMVRRIEETLGAVSILVNNAGVASVGTPVATSTVEESITLFRTHALGPMRLCQLVLPLMRQQERGDIVMISSSATELYAPHGVVYSMAKASMEAIAFTLAKEEARHGIRANVVAPGLVATELGSRLVRAVGGDGTEVEDLDRRAPFGHVCRPHEVAEVVAFLASEGGAYVNGQRIAVNGGQPGFMAAPRRSSGTGR